MNNGQISISNFRELFRQMLASDEAGLYASTVGENPPIVYRTIALDTAVLAGQEYEISVNFRSFVVLNTTDSSVVVNMKLGSKDSNVDAFPVRNNAELELPFPIQKAFLTWAAQPGKTISILFFTRGRFSTNQLVSSVAANVTLSDGDTVATQAGGAATASAAALFAMDSARKVMLIENQSGAPIYIGDSTVTLPGGAKPGLTIQSGGAYEWRSTAACYVIAAVAGPALSISLTKFS